MKPRIVVASAVLVICLAGLTWHRTHRNQSQAQQTPVSWNKSDSSNLPPKTKSASTERQAEAAKPGAKDLREVSDESVEMRNLAGVPVTAGFEGLWAGESPADAAIPGKTAYATARLGNSKADLKPDQNGMFQRLHAPVDSSIQFQVRYSDLKSGAVVHVGLLDGGKLDEQGPFKPDSLGRVSFRFQTGSTDGSYRLILTTSDHDVKMIDVWAGRPEWEHPITSK